MFGQAMAFHLSLWYSKADLARRVGIFISAGSVAGAFGGLIAFGVQHIKSSAAGRYFHTNIARSALEQVRRVARDAAVPTFDLPECVSLEAVFKNFNSRSESPLIRRHEKSSA